MTRSAGSPTSPKPTATSGSATPGNGFASTIQTDISRCPAAAAWLPPSTVNPGTSPTLAARPAPTASVRRKRSRLSGKLRIACVPGHLLPLEDLPSLHASIACASAVTTDVARFEVALQSAARAACSLRIGSGAVWWRAPDRLLRGLALPRAARLEALFLALIRNLLRSRGMRRHCSASRRRWLPVVRA